MPKKVLNVHLGDVERAIVEGRQKNENVSLAEAVRRFIRESVYLKPSVNPRQQPPSNTSTTR